MLRTDLLKTAESLTRLRKQQRDNAAMLFAHELRSKQQAADTLAHQQQAANAVEREHLARLAIGSHFDAAQIARSLNSIDGVRQRLLAAKTRLAQADRDAGFAREATLKRTCEHRVADHWLMDLHKQERISGNRNELMHALDAQTAARKACDAGNS